jgi:PleD family two-component response regulator
VATWDDVVQAGLRPEPWRDYAERVRAAFASDSPSGLPRVTLSAGVASAVAPHSLEPLIQGADSRLYAAKRAGRDRVVIDANRSSAMA